MLTWPSLTSARTWAPSTGPLSLRPGRLALRRVVVFPLAPDLFSLQALRNVGPTLREWRNDWQDRLERRPQVQDLQLPTADILPAGYIVTQHAVRAGRPVQAYQKWIKRIPNVYRKEALEQTGSSVSSTENDSECLATLKH